MAGKYTASIAEQIKRDGSMYNNILVLRTGVFLYVKLIFPARYAIKNNAQYIQSQSTIPKTIPNALGIRLKGVIVMLLVNKSANASSKSLYAIFLFLKKFRKLSVIFSPRKYVFFQSITQLARRINKQLIKSRICGEN
jgi:hypothetical protein